MERGYEAEAMPNVVQPTAREFRIADAVVPGRSSSVASSSTHAAKTAAFQQHVETAKKKKLTEKDTGLCSASASEDENSDDTRSSSEDSLFWLHRSDRTGTSVHIEADKPGVPLCFAASGTTLKEPYARGAGLDGLVDSTRPVCSKCLARVSQKSAKTISKLRAKE